MSDRTTIIPLNARLSGDPKAFLHKRDFKEKHTFVANAFISPFNTQAMHTK
jgi:hypothetical protein